MIGPLSAGPGPRNHSYQQAQANRIAELVRIDQVVLRAIRDGTLGQGSPYWGWSAEQFAAWALGHLNERVRKPYDWRKGNVA